MPSVGRSRDADRPKEEGIDTPRTLPEVPRTEDLQVFVVLGGSIFAISALIIGVILALSPK